ncbi:GDYXXLXY domain-containing protein [Flagellimonas crocea]|uniref:GDYXXLXY domain-containing protein n=1 Tax=Flagellimonas crocea TaxID=3067311 RepID=UPI00296E9F1C|nr:GDYXXLXY domain-containing protein [Muricauda sp. DH64]
MKNSKTRIVFLIVVALVQLYVPAKMVWNQESILEEGTEYKFKTAPVDPNDPFRGKYITLTFEENTFTVQDEMDWSRGEKVYVLLGTNKSGFAKIDSISKQVPNGQQDFVEAKAWFVSRNGENKVSIDYPFNRFYMEESKAYDAEATYQKSQIDTTKTTYALVSIKNGDAVLKDVLIDDIPIREIVIKEQSKDQR